MKIQYLIFLKNLRRAVSFPVRKSSTAIEKLSSFSDTQKKNPKNINNITDDNKDTLNSLSLSSRFRDPGIFSIETKK